MQNQRNLRQSRSFSLTVICNIIVILYINSVHYPLQKCQILYECLWLFYHLGLQGDVYIVQRCSQEKVFCVISLRHWRSPVNLLHIFITPFPKNTSERLVLIVGFSQFSWAHYFLFHFILFYKNIIVGFQKIRIVSKCLM